jgi:ATP-binding cassette subfamily B protein
VAADRIFKLMDDNSKIENIEGSFKTEPIGKVEFKNVWFAYVENEFVIKDVSFVIEPGKTLAIVGETGSGKSSIINLLLRFYPYEKGNIEIDSVDLNHWEPLFLRSRISLVLQDVFLFSGSIYDNIALHNPNVNMEKVIETSKLLGAHDFITKLPGAYDYKVMERGNTLSMGQRQMISFVRAMVTNPAILILDEATSSVDSETEEVIQKAIEKMMQNRTSIVIAHRLSTIEKADSIMVLNKGEILEKGTHQELMQKGEYYFNLQQKKNAE